MQSVQENGVTAIAMATDARVEGTKLARGSRSGDPARRAFVLQSIQPALLGLMDGAVSTLAPIFAAAGLTGRPLSAFFVGLAASLGAAISMGLSEALSDDGSITGRGGPIRRGTITGVATGIGGMLHTFPFLIPDLAIALRVAYAVVFFDSWRLRSSGTALWAEGSRTRSSRSSSAAPSSLRSVSGWDGSVRVEVARDQSREGEVAMRIGFIGLGHMGSGMAANLLRAGHDLTVHNRTPAKAEALMALGAKAVASVAEACRGDAVITMLANDEAVESVVLGPDGIIASLPAGALHVSSSTISVALSQRLTEEHAKASQRFVAAPVFGRPDVAAAGRLFVIAGGEPAALETAAPLLEAIGQKTFVVSDTPKAANLVKLSGNFLIASMIESLGEAFALVAKGGIDQRRYLEILTSSLFDAPLYKTYGGLIASGHFEPAGFAAPLGQKDIRLALAAAEDLRVPMPLASLLRDRFLTLLAHGGDNLDWSAIGRLPAIDAGISAH